MENVLTPIAKSVVVPLGSTAAATTKELSKKKVWIGMTAMVISNEEIEDIMKRVISLEQSNL